MHLSTKIVGKEFFFNISLKWSAGNLEKFETIENIQKINVIQIIKL